MEILQDSPLVLLIRRLSHCYTTSEYYHNPIRWYSGVLSSSLFHKTAIEPSPVMQRKEKEITSQEEMSAIIAAAKVCRLAMVQDNTPYVVPLSFGYHNNSLYFHGSLDGQKIEFIRKNPKVCFEFDQVFETLGSENPCNWSMKYKSIIGFGRALIIEDQEEKRTALKYIMAQYSDQEFPQFPDKALSATAAIKVVIESMTGKQSGFTSREE